MNRVLFDISKKQSDILSRCLEKLKSDSELTYSEIGVIKRIQKKMRNIV